MSKGILFYTKVKLRIKDVMSLAKISRSAIEKRIIYNSQPDYKPTPEETTEAMIKKFKKDTKRELTLEYYHMHDYHMTKKERRIAKQKLSKIKF